MASIQKRLDEMEAAIKKPSFRQSSGRANEVNYWVFDYPPEYEAYIEDTIQTILKRFSEVICG